MIFLLARRGLARHPVRSAILLLGFALGAAVMVVLLSVGEAILEQARDKDLLGGGDVVILPAGVDLEALKVGGLSAMFFQIPNARYLIGGLFEGQRFEDEVRAASPQLANRLVYVGRPGGRATAALASASIPSREAMLLGQPAPWSDTEASRQWLAIPRRATPEMDAFHLPGGEAGSAGASSESSPAPAGGTAAGTAPDSLWAEWHYFNLRRDGGDPYGYVTFMLAGDVRRGRAHGILLAQWREPGGRSFRASGVWPQDQVSFSTKGPGIAIGMSAAGGGARDGAGGAGASGAAGDAVAAVAAAPNRVSLVDGEYHVRATAPDGESGPISFDFTLAPVEGYFYPPFSIDRGGGLELGYVIPVLRGEARGTVRAGGRSYALDGYVGYHDHNWGKWDRVRWDWGQAVGPDLALFYGSVRAPSILDPEAFLALLNRRGLLQIFRIREIRREGSFRGPAANEAGEPVPARLVLQGATGPDSIRVAITVRDAVLSPGTAEGEEAGRFVQIEGRYEVRGIVAGEPVALDETGFAEVFLAARRAGTRAAAAVAAGGAQP
ncbi:MAG: hypothetical protein ACE15D_09010 [Candidatus Eisenbacteria bacterium]